MERNAINTRRLGYAPKTKQEPCLDYEIFPWACERAWELEWMVPFRGVERSIKSERWGELKRPSCNSRTRRGPMHVSILRMRGDWLTCTPSPQNIAERTAEYSRN